MILFFLLFYWAFSLLFVMGAAINTKRARKWIIFLFAPILLPVALGADNVAPDPEKDLQGSTESSTLDAKKVTDE